MATVRTKPRGKKQQDGARPASSPDRRARAFVSTGLVVLALIVAGAWAYSTSFAGQFVYDDEYAIQRNPNIKALWPLTRSMSAPPESPVSARPVASLSLAINYALAPPDVRDVVTLGREPAPDVVDRYLRNVWGYHFMNLALHLLAALALFGVVRRTLLTDRLRPRFGEASTPLAFVIALVWLVHPLTTDAVTYITQRTEVLMGLFYLLTLYCAIRASETLSPKSEVRSPQSAAGNDSKSGSQSHGVTPGRRAAVGWSVAAVAACALGMGSKQTMATAPFVVLIWDWIFLGDVVRSLWVRRLRWGLYAALAATWLILAAGLAFERWPHSIGMNREGWTPVTYFLTQLGVIVHYLRLAFWPAPLVIDYEGWPMARSILQVAPYLAVLAALGVVTAVLVWRRQPWGFLGAWFFALLAPSSSVLPLATEIAAERRMYTALPAIVALVVIGAYVLGRWAIARTGRRGAERAGIPGPKGPESYKAISLKAVVAAVVVGAVVLGLGTLTRARNRDYWSAERLWQDAVEKRPDNPRARLNYGVQLAAHGRHAEAEAQLREAVRLRDNYAAAHGNLGTVLCSEGRVQEGVAELEQAIALDPDFEAAYKNLGEAYGSLGRRELAAKYFALAVQRTPDDPFLLNRLGWLLATAPEDSVRNGAEAVRVGERAVRLTSGQDVESLETLAVAYAESDQFDRAAATAREAANVAMSQGNQQAAARLGQLAAMSEAHQKVRSR